VLGRDPDECGYGRTDRLDGSRSRRDFFHVDLTRFLPASYDRRDDGDTEKHPDDGLHVVTFYCGNFSWSSALAFRLVPEQPSDGIRVRSTNVNSENRPQRRLKHGRAPAWRPPSEVAAGASFGPRATAPVSSAGAA